MIDAEQRSEYNRRYYILHRAKMIASARKWALANPGKVQESKKKSAAKLESKIKKKAYDARWRKEINPGAHKAIRKRCRSKPSYREKAGINWKNWKSNNINHLKKYRQEHKAERRTRSVKYRAIKLAATIGDQDVVRKIYARALELRQWFDVAVDHIIPLKRGGTHSADNLQIIYGKENSAKGSKLNYVPQIIFQ